MFTDVRGKKQVKDHKTTYISISTFDIFPEKDMKYLLE